MGERDEGAQVRGTVQAVGDHSLTVMTASGNTVTVMWDVNTECTIGDRSSGEDRPHASVCGRIQVGDFVKAEGQRMSSALNAREIKAGVLRTGQPSANNATGDRHGGRGHDDNPRGDGHDDGYHHGGHGG